MPLEELSPIAPDELDDFLKGALRNRSPSDDELANVLHSLGLDQSTNISNAIVKDKLTEGTQLLIK